MKSKSYIYFSALEYSNVFLTQVVDWLNLYKKGGIDFTLFRTTSLKKVFSSDNFRDTIKSKNAYDKFKCKLYFGPPRFIVGLFYNSLIIAIIVLKYLRKAKVVVLQTRDAELSNSFKLLKSVLGKRLYLIFDSRAAGAEELKYSNGGVVDPQVFKKFYRTIENEKRMVSIADRVFCVSNVLIDYHKKLNPNINGEKFFLYPCLANPNYFFYSSKEREKLRSALNIDNRIVFVYSGGMRMPWHLPDQMVNMMSEMIRKDPRFYFLILTKDNDIASELLEKQNFSSEDYSIKALDNYEIHKYLSAADMALLLREDVPMNNVASPTKFAEYVMCGLPVLISKNVGDFSQFVSDQNIGLVVNSNFSDNEINDLERLLKSSLPEYQSRRNEIVSLGHKHFSKDVNLGNILNVYHSI